MNILFIRVLEDYCSFVIVLCKIWLTVPIQHQLGSLECFFHVCSSLPKEMITPGPQDHFLRFCCGLCLRNQIKYLVRKSDVGSRYNFFQFTFRSLVLWHISGFETKIMSFCNFSMMLKSPFFRLSILILRLILVLSIATQTGL